jgi:hypothetical protein
LKGFGTPVCARRGGSFFFSVFNEPGMATYPISFAILLACSMFRSA